MRDLQHLRLTRNIFQCWSRSSMRCHENIGMGGKDERQKWEIWCTMPRRLLFGKWVLCTVALGSFSWIPIITRCSISFPVIEGVIRKVFWSLPQSGIISCIQQFPGWGQMKFITPTVFLMPRTWMILNRNPIYQPLVCPSWPLIGVICAFGDVPKLIAPSNVWLYTFFCQAQVKSTCTDEPSTSRFVIILLFFFFFFFFWFYHCAWFSFSF